MATGWTALCAFGKGNLEAIARVAREKKPDSRIIIAGDVGSEKHAQQAAIAIDGEVAIPPLQEDGADFNDLHIAEGLEVVKQALEASEVVSEWPAFIPLDTPNAPHVDLDYLPTWAGNYARALSEATETPPELAAGMVLVTCAAAAARRLNVMVKPGYFEPCNLWIVVALVPGNRKSAVQAGATAPLIEWEREQLELQKPEIDRLTSERKTMEARIKVKRNLAAKEKSDALAGTHAREAADLEAELPEIPIPPQLWTSDATPERLGTLLADQGECMAWLSSEGGVFDLLQGRYSGGIPNLDLVLKAHSGDAERVDRGSRPPVFLRRPRLSIGLSPQPDVLSGLSGKPGFRGRGLLGRFLYLLPPSPLGYRSLKTVPVPDSIQSAYTSGLRTMLDWKPAKNENGEDVLHILKLSTAAYSEWHEFAKAIELQMQPDGSMEHITDWAGKAPGAAIRLAGVIHGIKHTNPWQEDISEETMNEALEIMAVFTLHSRAAFDMMGADPSIAAARRVWCWIERNRQPSFTVRDVFNGTKGTFHRVKEVRHALDVLEERGYVEVMDVAPLKPGRPPSPTVQVRPELSEKWR
jgi:hypothetical protein